MYTQCTQVYTFVLFCGGVAARRVAEYCSATPFPKGTTCRRPNAWTNPPERRTRGIPSRLLSTGALWNKGEKKEKQRKKRKRKKEKRKNRKKRVKKKEKKEKEKVFDECMLGSDQSLHSTNVARKLFENTCALLPESVSLSQ